MTSKLGYKVFSRNRITEKKLFDRYKIEEVHLRHFCIKVFGSLSQESDEACLTPLIGGEDKKSHLRTNERKVITVSTAAMLRTFNLQCINPEGMLSLVRTAMSLLF
ncbi:hypothetical protein NPIL_599211 [Nephila pilipes]|uniref:Uncharacterized protein n=1 Tax=Nephila pilipes TaxID=299642 RepID=A0A8X6ND65_NEPPI|nr:hypothetical protein NPIL_599211 [Nephila pilipes]